MMAADHETYVVGSNGSEIHTPTRDRALEQRDQIEDIIVAPVEPAVQDNDRAAEELTSIMFTSLHPPSSNPVSPGSSSTAPIQSAHRSEPMPANFTPPARPSSTPFPHPERRNSVCCQDQDQEDIEGQSLYAVEGAIDDDSDNNLSDETVPTAPSPSLSGYEIEVPDAPASSTAVNLDDLPAEIHEAILDHLFGYRVSTASKSSMDIHCVTRSWGTILRHSRRKELAELALVSPTWRCLIQQRLYRHIKIRATIESIEQAMSYFEGHQHLQSYVKHIELWFPVFQRAAAPLTIDRGRQLPTNHLRDGSPEPQPGPTYALPMGKCTLQEAFLFVRQVLPSVRVLTLEGGERRKAPKVLHFIQSVARSLCHLPTVETLVTKGQWNLMRDNQDFDTVLSALPNLKEWHGSYSRPKSKSYLSMATVLPHLPSNITQLHICLEGEYRRELACPPFFRKVASQIHFCTALASAVPALEQFSYTGRVCRTFFDALVHKVDPRTTRLRSINITARNCCRPLGIGSESGCGIQDLNFMHAFEMLVLAGIRSLSKLHSLEYLRIRYIDLDSPVPPLNPFFLMRNGWVSGVWSESILAELQRSRPSLRFEDIRDNFGEISYNKEGRMVISPEYPRPRILGLKLANYALLADGITMQH